MALLTKLSVVTEVSPDAILINLDDYEPSEAAAENLACGSCDFLILRGANVLALEKLYKGHVINNHVHCPKCNAKNALPHLPQCHPSFKAPTEPTIKLWRYMDLAKFVSLLQRRAIFFSKASLLGDPYEGSTPKMNKAIQQAIVENRKKIPLPPFSIYKDMTDDQIRSYVDGMSQARRRMVDWFHVSCWHMSEFESAAMWKLYTFAQESICIQTTYYKLREHMPSDVHIGVMEYIDYDTKFIDENNAFNFIMIKRQSFDHERELRAVRLEGVDLNSTGTWIDVDLSSFLDNIYLSPTAPGWFLDSIGNYKVYVVGFVGYDPLSLEELTRCPATSTAGST